MLLVVAGVDVVHQLCKAGVRGSIPLVSTKVSAGHRQSPVRTSRRVEVDRLAKSPIPLESLTSDLGIDGSDVDKLYRLGVDTSLFKTVETGWSCLMTQ